MIAAALLLLVSAAAEPHARPDSGAPAPARRAAPADPPRDAWFGPDKVKHFFLSAFIQSVAYSALRAGRVEHGTALAGASITAAGFGVGKELHDWRARREFSARDLLWDAAGAASAAAVMTHTLR